MVRLLSNLSLVAGEYRPVVFSANSSQNLLSVLRERYMANRGSRLMKRFLVTENRSVGDAASRLLGRL